MASSNEFADEVTGRLLPFGPVVARRMFGGFGVYLDGVMFGLIGLDRLYFKVDDGNRAEYQAAGSEPFSYQGRNRPISLSYWRVPDPVFEDAGELSGWAERALAAARRAKSAKKPRKSRKKSTNP
jgi:DNA transformation protein and related proteins